MGLESTLVIYAAKQRERSDLGGMVTFEAGDPIPCAMGGDTTSLQRAPTSDGFQLDQTRRITVRTSLLTALPRLPRSGDTAFLKGNLENKPATLQIADVNGVSAMNAILTVIEFYNPKV